MNPLKLLFTKRDNGQYDLQTEDETDDDVSSIDIIGGIVWVIAISLYWNGAGYFDHTPGRLGFIPALIIAWMIGFYTTTFLIGTTICIAICGWLIGWIFDFPFFDTAAEYIGIAYRYLFK